MSDRYDIFFTGKIVDGFDEATVRENVAKLFKANAQTLEKLFSGKPQAIKRGVDKQAAIKYKAAMEKAGAVPVIRAHKDAAAQAAPAPAPAPAAEELPSSADIKPKQTMAERLAALTGEDVPSEDTPPPAAAPAPAPAAAPAAEPASPGPASFGEGMSLAPAGSDVLRDDEREVVEAQDIDTSAIHLTPEFAEPVVEETAAPPAPDVSHLSMGEVGDDIPHLDDDVEELDLDISHLSMGDVGEDIPHLEDDQELLDPDISGIDLAPEGSDVLDEQYRKEEAVEAPNTDHLSLET